MNLKRKLDTNIIGDKKCHVDVSTSRLILKATKYYQQILNNIARVEQKKQTVHYKA